MSHTSDSFVIDNPNRLTASIQALIRAFRKLSFHSTSISKLLWQLEEVTTPIQLTRTVNRVQNLLWKLPTKEQGAFRQSLINVLSKHVLQGVQARVRLEAAGWLRLFVQAGLVAQPKDVFVTLVTATSRAPRSNPTNDINEQRAYLKMIFECFWPYRHPYPAYSWQALPKNEVFYPLAPLFDQADYAMQDALMGIYSELTALDDGKILEHLLPVALQWSKHTDPERRRRVANVLARINQESAQEALRRLQFDSDLIVRESAKSAGAFVRKE
jgi:hypothetical protein